MGHLPQRGHGGIGDCVHTTHFRRAICRVNSLERVDNVVTMATDPRNGSVGVWRAICATVGWIPSLRTFNGTETNGASLHPRPRIMVSEQVCSIAHYVLLVSVCVSVIYLCVCMCVVSLLWFTRLRRPVTTHESAAKPRSPFVCCLFHRYDGGTSFIPSFGPFERGFRSIHAFSGLNPLYYYIEVFNPLLVPRNLFELQGFS